MVICVICVYVYFSPLSRLNITQSRGITKNNNLYLPPFEGLVKCAQKPCVNLTRAKMYKSDA